MERSKLYYAGNVTLQIGGVCVTKRDGRFAKNLEEYIAAIFSEYSSAEYVDISDISVHFSIKGRFTKGAQEK